MSKLEFLVSGNEVGTSVRFHPCRRRQLELRRRSSSSRRSVSTRPAVSINCTSFFLKKMGNPWPLFSLFSSFQTNITIFTTYICEKCLSSIWCWDSNPQPSGHESPPTTTRPGIPPLFYIIKASLT